MIHVGIMLNGVMLKEVKTKPYDLRLCGHVTIMRPGKTALQSDACSDFKQRAELNLPPGRDRLRFEGLTPERK